MTRLILHRMLFLTGCFLMAVTGLIGTDQVISFDKEHFAPQVRTAGAERFTIRQRTAMLRVRRPAAPARTRPLRSRTERTAHLPPELGPPGIRSDDRSVAEPG